MNGARSLLETAVRAGVRVCFANPGTTELSLVSALDEVDGLRAVLVLFEGVATGAADGYARMLGVPALTLLHLGPSFANGIANLHNARRARTPLVNLVGEHPTWHRPFDPPLASDIESLARPVSGWVRRCASAERCAGDLSEAIAAAAAGPGQVATLIVPADCQWGEGAPAAPRPPSAPPALEARALETAAQALRRGGAALLLGGKAQQRRGLLAAARIAAHTGCRLLGETFPARLEVGRGLPRLERFPYIAPMAQAQLASVQALVLVGADAPVAYFADRDGKSRLVPEHVEVMTLAQPQHDGALALEALADALGAAPHRGGVEAAPPSLGTGALTAASAVSSLAALLPEGAIVVDEGVSAAGLFPSIAAGAPPFSYLTLTGGATGQGLPCATGAAIACPERPVVAWVGDGAALYTVQALWTQAREGLHVITVICANDRYRILELELARKQLPAGPKARSLTELSGPTLDWEALARGFGVPASTARTVEALAEAFRRALSTPGPTLIVARL